MPLSGEAAGAFVGARMGAIGVLTGASGGKDDAEATLMAPGAMLGSHAGAGRPMALLTATVASCRGKQACLAAWMSQACRLIIDNLIHECKWLDCVLI